MIESDIELDSKSDFQNVVERMRDMHPEAYTRPFDMPLSTNHQQWKMKVLASSAYGNVRNYYGVELS